MTGRELIDWIRENGAEDMTVLHVEDEAVFRVHPEVVDNAELKRGYVNTRRLREGEKSILLT